MLPGQRTVEWRKRVYEKAGVKYDDEKIVHEDEGTGKQIILNDAKIFGNGGNPLIRVGTNGKALTGWINGASNIQKGDLIMTAIVNGAKPIPFVVDNVDYKPNPVNRNLNITTIRCIN